MANLALSRAAERYANLVQALPDEALDKPWAWLEYDSEGVRFSFFRLMEDLRSLAVRAAPYRRDVGNPLTQAQRILKQYHIADRELDCLLLGLDEATAGQAPGEDQWPVRQAFAHMVQTEAGFFVCVAFALERCRRGEREAVPIPDEAWGPIINMEEAKFGEIMRGSFQGLQEFHREWHARILREFSQITDDELEALSIYWEKIPQPLRFRLHRFESHLRQHTVQIEKTLVSTGRPLTESRRLLRLIYSALGEAEGSALGVEDTLDGLFSATASEIDERTDTVETALSK
jgi:hypothetical protein